MKRATAVEKRFFPWTGERFVQSLQQTMERLHWRDCQITNAFATGKLNEQIKLGDNTCPLEFTMKASWRQIGNGVELVLSVSEDNSWSIVECKKKCAILLDLLCEPLFPRQYHKDAALR